MEQKPHNYTAMLIMTSPLTNVIVNPLSRCFAPTRSHCSSKQSPLLSQDNEILSSEDRNSLPARQHQKLRGYVFVYKVWLNNQNSLMSTMYVLLQQFLQNETKVFQRFPLQHSIQTLQDIFHRIFTHDFNRLGILIWSIINILPCSVPSINMIWKIHNT